jgi:hypothetical protein
MGLNSTGYQFVISNNSASEFTVINQMPLTLDANTNQYVVFYGQYYPEQNRFTDDLYELYPVKLHSIGECQ